MRERRRRASKYCGDYEGKLIAFYNDAFRVTQCRRIPVSYAELNEALKGGEEVMKVTSEVIYALPLAPGSQRSGDGMPGGGGGLGDSPGVPPCVDLENTYITPDQERVYFVENCRKRAFNSWSDYTRDRFKRGVQKTRLIFLTEQVMSQIRSGRDMPAPSLDPMVQQMNMADEQPQRGADVCRELEGKFISYFSFLYKVERCRKRAVNSLEYSRRSYELAQKLKLSEANRDDLHGEGKAGIRREVSSPLKITTEQWIHLPLVSEEYQLTDQDFTVVTVTDSEVGQKADADKVPRASATEVKKPAVRGPERSPESDIKNPTTQATGEF